MAHANTYHYCKAYRANCEKSKRNFVPMKSDPACHPSQQENAKAKEGSDIEKSIGFVSKRALRLVGDDEQLSGVQEDRVDLSHEG